MAWNTKIWPIFRWANGWISDDLFTGIQNSYYYSDKIEVREDAKSIFPYTQPATILNTYSYTLWTETDKPVEMLMTKESVTDLYIFCWKSVYRVDISLFDNVPVQLCTFPDKICDAETFNWYIYISTTWGLYIISETADNTTWSNLGSETTVTWTPYHWRIKQFSRYCEYHPLFWSDIILAVWDYEEMLSISKETCDTYSTGFSLQESYMIKMITELWWFLRIVADDGMWGSEIIMWDKISDAANEIIPFTWYKFLQTCIYNWYQYLLSDKGLWVLNGYQYYILKKAQEWIVSSPAHNAMCVHNDKIYFATAEWLYIYWAKNKNYNDVLSQWTSMKKCWCLYSDWLTIYTSCWKQGSYNYSMAWWSWDWINTLTWELQTMAYFWTWLSEIKQALYLRVWYKIPRYNNRTGEIHIYYRTEADATTNNPDDWSWHPVQENDIGLSATRDMRSPFATSLKLNCRFQWIQFKFVLTNCKKQVQGTDYLRTHLYSADLYYNTMLD
jgi:hypothetical protein